MVTRRGKTEGTMNKTFRLDKSLVELLENEARIRNVTTNALVSDLIDKDLRKGYALRGINTVLVPALAMKLFTEGLSTDETIVEIAEKVSKDALGRTVPRKLGGSMSVEAILQAVKLLNECDESEQNGKKMLIISHYCGRNYSLFLGAFHKAVFASVGANVNYSISDDAVILQFD
jgi:hypothetical protein